MYHTLHFPQYAFLGFWVSAEGLLTPPHPSERNVRRGNTDLDEVDSMYINMHTCKYIYIYMIYIYDIYIYIYLNIYIYI